MDSSDSLDATMKYAATLSGLRKCSDIRPRPFVGQRGDYWVVYNYVQANQQFRCWESVTYTTHADFTFLDNLEPLLSRWKGPISLALYAPGTDFNATLWAIRYLRDCGIQLVADLVTFHIYFPAKHMPETIPKSWSSWETEYNCTLLPPWVNATTYRAQKKLLYPVNVGRNVAKEMATTHFIFPSDIELYPSPGVIEAFLQMIRRNDPPLRGKNPRVFPLPVFELVPGANVPINKTELVAMLNNGTAILFHQNICPGCHKVPQYGEWVRAESTGQGEGGDLRTFHIGKRVGSWEPIYIGTRADPHYDERLPWEGQSDKMTQAYALCVLDYDFHILDNAFLVHKPGIKTYHNDPARAIQIENTKSLLRTSIKFELEVLYGVKEGCFLIEDTNTL